MPALPAAVPDLDALVAWVLDHATHPASVLHGPQHWQAVGRAGALLLEASVPADPAVVFSFALLHDSRRLDDGDDPEHGPRAAALLERLPRSLLDLDDAQRAALAHACATHTGGAPTDDPTVGACYDADRLNLWRVGTVPDPRLLSTAPAREPETIRRCSAAVREPAPWPGLLARYSALGGAPRSASRRTSGS